MSILKEGQTLQAITWPDDQSIIVHEEGLETLVVVMDSPLAAALPWVRATYDTGEVFLHNSAHLASVKLGGKT